MKKLFFSQAILAVFFSSVVSAQNHLPEFSMTWGTCGNGTNQFQGPGSLVVISDYLFVVDTNNSRVPSFTTDGVFVNSLGEQGNGDGQFSVPFGCAVDENNFLYVSDLANKSVQKFTANGIFSGKLEPPSGFSQPISIAIFQGIVYVTDRGEHNKVPMFTTDGEFLGYFAEEYSFVGPFDIAVLENNILITEPSVIKRFSLAGDFIGQFGGSGSSNGQFSYDVAIGIELLTKNIYAVDVQGHRINVFSENGEFLFTWGTYGHENGQFVFPFDVVFDTHHYLYVSDWDNCRIQKFLLQGTPVVPISWGRIKTKFN